MLIFREEEGGRSLAHHIIVDAEDETDAEILLLKREDSVVDGDVLMAHLVDEPYGRMSVETPDLMAWGAGEKAHFYGVHHLENGVGYLHVSGNSLLILCPCVLLS